MTGNGGNAPLLPFRRAESGVTDTLSTGPQRRINQRRNGFVRVFPPRSGPTGYGNLKITPKVVTFVQHRILKAAPDRGWRVFRG